MERLSIRLIRWLVVLVAFGLMPLGIINYGVRQMIDDRWNTYVENQATRLGTIMENAQKSHVPEKFFYTVLAQFNNRLDQSGLDQRSRNQLARRFSERWRGLFDVFTLDASGTLTFPDELPAGVAVFSLKKLAEALRDLPSTSKVQAGRGLFRYFLGEDPPNQSLAVMHDEQQVVGINPLGKRSFFYGYSDHLGTLIAHVNTGVIPEWYTLRAFAERARRRLPQYAFGVWSLGEELVSASLKNSEKRAVMRALAELELSMTPWIERDGLLIRSHSLDASYRFWAVHRLNSGLQGNTLRLRVELYSLLFFLALAAFTFSWLVQGWRLRVSIRWKLIGLFGIASGLPLILLLVTGYDYLVRTEQVLKFEALRKLQDSLKMVDSRFPRFLHDCRKRILQTTAEAKAKQPVDFQKFVDSLDEMRDELGFFTPNVVKSDGTVYQGHRNSGDQGRDRLMLALAFEMMRRYNRNLGYAEDGGKQVKSVELALLNDAQIGGAVEGLFRGLGKFTRIHFGKNSRLVLLDFFLGENGRADALMMLAFATDRVFYRFLKKYQARYQKAFGFGTLYSFHERKQFMVPEDAFKQEWLDAFRLRLLTRREVISEEQTIQGVPHLIVGMPGKEMESFMLVQTIPTQAVTGVKEELKTRLTWLGGICLALALASGFLLAGQFLQPIASLTEGVQAIQAGMFRHRVPETLTHDELADLSDSFNTTLEKLQELSTARTLQESLFPVALLRLGCCEVFGKSVAATELGGDYFDYFAVGDRQIMLLIGDVAGHGTGSALQMAMAKTGMHFIVQIDPSPGKVCERLNHMILSCMRKKQMMTFFCALIDAETGVVRYANAGHNNPMLIRADGMVEEMASGGYPLGVRKTVAYAEKELQLNPGDRIWCYTDGLPECRDASDQDLGYDRLRSILRLAAEDTALETCDLVLRQCNEYRRGAPQGDDMTLILLKRS